MATTLTVKQILCLAPGELKFNYPKDATPSQIDKRYEWLRVEHSGVRAWDFEESPPDLEEILQKPCPHSIDWKLFIVLWQRYASSERMIQDLFSLSLIYRVNVAFYSAGEDTKRMSIIGQPTYFYSLGGHDHPEGKGETTIAPDWMVVMGNADGPPDLENLDDGLVAWGDTKLRGNKLSHPDLYCLPGTKHCPEAYAAQVVQYCIDSQIRFGFVLTDHELVLFQLIKQLYPSEPRNTRQREPVTSSSPPRQIDSSEKSFSSPLGHSVKEWKDFDSGYDDIPLITQQADEGHQVSDQATSVSDTSMKSPELPPQSPEPSPQSSPCPGPKDDAESISGSNDYPGSSSDIRMDSSSDWKEDRRMEDATHLLIKSYLLDNINLPQRLFEFCMLAKRAKDCKVSNLGPGRITFEALREWQTSDAMEIAL